MCRVEGRSALLRGLAGWCPRLVSLRWDSLDSEEFVAATAALRRLVGPGSQLHRPSKGAMVFMARTDFIIARLWLKMHVYM